MDDAAETTSFLTFGLGTNGYAIPLTRVREIVACRKVVRVPNAGDSVRGVMNLRGNVVPVLDLARHLALGDTELSDSTCAVLLDTDIDGENSPLGALVKEIRSVIDVAANEIAEPPDFGAPVDPRHLHGVLHDGELIYVLDLDAILASLM